MATIGTLVTNVIAKTAGFVSGMKRASTSTTKFGKVTEGVSKKIAGFGSTLIAGLGVAGLTAAIGSTLASIDKLAKTSDKLGLPTEKLAGLRFAAEQTGVAAGTLDLALQRMTRRIAEAAQGTGEAKSALKELGLDAIELSAIGPDKAFSKIADAMQKVQSPADRLRLAFKLFDSEGAALVNTLAGGSAGLEEFQRQAEAAGIAVTRIEAAQIEKTNDAINKAKQSVQGLTNEITQFLAPSLEVLAESLSLIGSGKLAPPVAKSEFVEAKNLSIDLATEIEKLERLDNDILGIRKAQIANLREQEAAANKILRSIDKTKVAEEARLKVSQQQAKERAAANAIQAQSDAVNVKAAKLQAELAKEILKAKGETGVQDRIAAFERELGGGQGAEAIIFNLKQQQKELNKINKIKQDIASRDDEAATARKAARGFQQKLAKDGEALEKSLRTPFEMAQVSIRKWLRLLKAGAIEQKTFDRATQNLLKEFAPEQEAVTEAADKGTRLVGAIGRNTLAEASFLNKQKFGPSNEPTDRIIKRMEAQLEEEQIQTALIKELVEKTQQDLIVIRGPG